MVLSEFGYSHSREKLFAAGPLTLKIAEDVWVQHPPTLNHWEFVSVEPHGSQPDGSLEFAPVD